MDKGQDILWCDSGRTALEACLKHLGLKPQDEVLIVTTTNGPYISGCVTKTIEKNCRWSRTLNSRTRLGLVIHEFGFPCPQKKFLPLQQHNIPILEDCAYAFGSRTEGADIGCFGQFGLYSFPKYFPVPFGGILVAQEKINLPFKKAYQISPGAEKLLHNTLHNSLKEIKGWNKKRREYWQLFAKALRAPGLIPYFSLAKGVVPGVYLTRVPQQFPGEQIKEKLNLLGIESTQYYNQHGFYFPCHQFLTPYETSYILHHFIASLVNVL